MMVLIFMTIFVGAELFPAAAAAATPALPPFEATDFAIKWWCDVSKDVSAEDKLAIAGAIKGMLTEPCSIPSNVVAAIGKFLQGRPKEDMVCPNSTFGFWTENHSKRFGSQAKAVAEAVLALTDDDGKALLARKMREWYGASSVVEREKLAAQALAAKVAERKDRFDLALGDAVYTLQTAYIARKKKFATLVVSRFPGMSEAHREARVYFLLSHALDIAEGDDDAALVLLLKSGLDPEAMKAFQDEASAGASGPLVAQMAALQKTYVALGATQAARQAEITTLSGSLASVTAAERATAQLLQAEQEAHASTSAARTALEGELHDAQEALLEEQDAHDEWEHISDAIIRSARQHKRRWKALEVVLAAIKDELTETQATLDASIVDRGVLAAFLADERAMHQAAAESRAAIEDALARERAENEALQAQLAEAHAAVESATASERAAREAEVEALKRTLEQQQAGLAAAHVKEGELSTLQAGHQELAAKYRHSLVMLKRAEDKLLSQSPAALAAPLVVENKPSWAVAWSPSEWKGAEAAVWFPWLFFMSFYGSGFVNSKEWVPDIARTLKLTDLRDFVRKRVIPKKMLEKPVYRKIGAALFTALTMWGVKQCLETFSGQSYALLRSSAAGSTTRLSPNFDSLIPLACLASFVWDGGAALFAPPDEEDVQQVA